MCILLISVHFKLCIYIIACNILGLRQCIYEHLTGPIHCKFILQLIYLIEQIFIIVMFGME